MIGLLRRVLRGLRCCARAGSPCYLVAFLLSLCASGALGAGRNIDLSTAPRRDSVQLTIYNSEDLTLVRERRAVTFKKGINPLQFSWANTLIDPSSVELKFVSDADKLEVLDTTFPHDRPQILYWNVKSDLDGEGQIEITYFTSGITWKADYTAIANQGETAMNLEGFVRVFNNSGEQYEKAQIRLVVGTINLVERIADLAGVHARDSEDLAKKVDEKQIKVLRTRAAKGFAMETDRLADKFEFKEKEIIKEGLSEYFIYTIDGTETIPSGWSKRMRSFEGSEVPFKIQYRYRPAEYGDQLIRMYLLTNDKESKLGTTPLPDGMVRVFRENGRDGLSFLAAQQIKYIPIADKIELNLGVDPNVVFELRKISSSRDNIWMQIAGTDVFRQVGGAIAVEVNSNVAGWDDHESYQQRISNFTAKEIDVEIRRSFPGHVLFRSQLEARAHDFQTVELRARTPAGSKQDLSYQLTRKQGHNASQNNVTIEKQD